MKKSKIYLYIDTNIFFELHFNLKKFLSQFNELSYHMGEDFIILTNSILKGEFIKNYEERLEKAKEKLEGFPFSWKFSKELERLRNKISSQSGESAYKDFLSKFPCENIDASIPWTDVFGDYFSCSIPFDKNKKKSEFPDAFVFKLLEKYIDNKNRLFIVSNDNDFKRWAEKFNKKNVKTFDGLLSFFDHCTKFFGKDPDRKLFLSNYLHNVNEIKNDIKEKVIKNIFNQGILNEANSKTEWIVFKKVLGIESLKVFLIDILKEKDALITCVLDTVIKFDYTDNAYEYIHYHFGEFHYNNLILRRLPFLRRSKVCIALSIETTIHFSNKDKYDITFPNIIDINPLTSTIQSLEKDIRKGSVVPYIIDSLELHVSDDRFITQPSREF